MFAIKEGNTVYGAVTIFGGFYNLDKYGFKMETFNDIESANKKMKSLIRYGHAWHPEVVKVVITFESC